MMQFDQTIKDLYETAGKIYQAVGSAITASVAAGEADARATTLWKDRSGDTRQSIKGTKTSMDTGALIAGGASKLLEEGTRPHVITGKGGGFLRFEMNGQTMFRRSVNHPGTAPRPFMQHARDQAEKVLDYGLEYLIDRAVK